MHRGQLGDVPHKEEEGHKGAQQGVVDGGQHLPVVKQEEQGGDEGDYRGGQHLEHPQQAQAEPRAVAEQVPGLPSPADRSTAAMGAGFSSRMDTASSRAEAST